MDEKSLEEIGNVLAERLASDVKGAVKEEVGEQIETLKEDITKDVEEKIAEVKTTAEATGADVKVGEDASLKGELSGAEVMSKFIRGVGLNDAALVEEAQKGSSKAMGELTGANGGFLVPEELIAEIWRIQGLQGIVRSQARIVPMVREQMHVNRIGTNVTSYWAGHTVSMTESSPTIERVTLQAELLTGLTMFETELLQDESAGLVSELTQLFAEVMSTEEDNQAFNGTGAPFVGIFNDADVTVVGMTTADNTFEELIPNDLRKLLYNISSKALKGAAFYMSPYAWHLIQIMTQDSKYLTTFSNPVFSKGAWTPEQITDSAGTIWGYPVFLSDQLPGAADTAASTKWIIFGNMKYFLVGDRKGTEAKVSEDGYVSSTSLFETNQSAIRITRRVAMSVGIPEAFAVLRTAVAT